MMAEKQEAAAEALLMLMQFSINQVSLEVQSRGVFLCSLTCVLYYLECIFLNMFFHY